MPPRRAPGVSSKCSKNAHQLLPAALAVGEQLGKYPANFEQLGPFWDRAPRKAAAGGSPCDEGKGAIQLEKPLRPGRRRWELLAVEGDEVVDAVCKSDRCWSALVETDLVSATHMAKLWPILVEICRRCPEIAPKSPPHCVVEAFYSVNRWAATAAELLVVLEPHHHSRLLPGVQSGHGGPLLVHRYSQDFDPGLGFKRPAVVLGASRPLCSSSKELSLHGTPFSTAASPGARHLVCSSSGGGRRVSTNHTMGQGRSASHQSMQDSLSQVSHPAAIWHFNRLYLDVCKRVKGMALIAAVSVSHQSCYR